MVHKEGQFLIAAVYFFILSAKCNQSAHQISIFYSSVYIISSQKMFQFKGEMEENSDF